jgi:hypothetical protein
LYICYIDESGGFEIPGSSGGATPLMVIAGLIIDVDGLNAVTNKLIDAKRIFYPNLCPPPHSLDDIQAEVKGSDIRKGLRSTARNDRRHGMRFLEGIVRTFETDSTAIIGRIWIKEVGVAMQPSSSYAYAIQDMARLFERFLAEKESLGAMICDSRMHNQNSMVSHSIFTQKHRSGGDPLAHIMDVPTFGSIKNHAGLQLADFLASSLLFPIAARVYCSHLWNDVHTSPHFDAVRTAFSKRLAVLEYSFVETGRTKGGVVVSDKLRRLPSSLIFSAP